MPAPSLPRTRSGLTVLLLLAGWMTFVPPALAATDDRRTFDIPAGEAVPALRRFAAQSGLQVIYAGEAVANVKTTAVKGDFTPREALARMLTRTDLLVREDRETGALAIVPVKTAGRTPPSADLNSSETQKKTDAMKTTRNPLAALAGWLALTLAPAPAAAADSAASGGATGTLAGRVLDRGGGIGLPGADVAIAGSTLATSTDRQGDFVLPGVSAGTHTVQISYVGRAPVTQTITVTGGIRTPLRVELDSSETVQLDRFVVTGIVEGAARALNQQRTAANLQNIVSADAIGQFPDPNIAEALQRVVGIGVQRDQGEGRYIQVRGTPMEFSSITIDGVSVPPTDAAIRAVDLDTIPSDVVSALEITKALRAEIGSPQRD